jgi:hypothetical protein
MHGVIEREAQFISTCAAYQLDFYTEALSLDFLLPYIACPALTPGDMLPSDGGGSDEENLQQSGHLLMFCAQQQIVMLYFCDFISRI